jgi:hypothetical protein
MPMGDHEAVEGRTAVRPDGAGGVVRRSTENCMTLDSVSPGGVGAIKMVYNRPRREHDRDNGPPDPTAG